MTAQNAAFWQAISPTTRVDAFAEAGTVTCIYRKGVGASALPSHAILPSLLGAIWQSNALRGKVAIVSQRWGLRSGFEDSLKRVGMDPRQLQAFRQLLWVDPTKLADLNGIRYLVINGAEDLSLEQLASLLSSCKVIACFLTCLYESDALRRLLHASTFAVECALVEPPTRSLHGRLSIRSSKTVISPSSSSTVSPSSSSNRTVLFRASDSALFVVQSA